MALTIQQIQDRITAGYDQRDIINLLADYIQANMPLTPNAQTKIWVGTLSQTGTNAPEATVEENTLGGTIIWTRLSAGLYHGTLTGAFPNPGTIVQVQDVFGGTSPGAALANAPNAVAIATNNADDNLYETPVLITVYR